MTDETALRNSGPAIEAAFADFEPQSYLPVSRFATEHGCSVVVDSQRDRAGDRHERVWLTGGDPQQQAVRS